MATTETPPTHEALGSEGEPCPSCSAPLAADQRYCLNCGHRRGPAHAAYSTLLASRTPEEVAPAAGDAPPPRRHLPAWAVAAAGGAGALLLGVGVIGGALLKGDPPPQKAPEVNVAAAKAPIVNVTGGGGTAATDFTSDWPEGKTGYTVQLQTLPNTDPGPVAQAKTDAEGKGAKAVGALDSDEYPSLKGGNYVIYSGVYTGKDGKTKAQKAAKGLKTKFPDAKVVKVEPDAAAAGAEGTLEEEKGETVDDGTLKDLQNSTGESQQKKEEKLPDTTVLPGKPPAKDKKAPGGGDGGEDIQ